MARIFISYKRVDKDKVFKIKDQIESALGEKCWIDLDGIESDAVFKKVIINAINECEIVLFMYSKAHCTIQDFEKDWTVRELNYAAIRNKRIVFVNLDASRLTDEFVFDYGMKQQIDGGNRDSVEHLISDLKKWRTELIVEKRVDECPLDKKESLLSRFWFLVKNILSRNKTLGLVLFSVVLFVLITICLSKEESSSVEESQFLSQTDSLHNKYFELAIPFKYYDANYFAANSFNDGLARIRRNGKYGYIDKNGNEVIPCQFEDADDFSCHRARIKENGKYGYINKKGEVVIECDYEEAEIFFYENLAWVKKEGKYGYVDIFGKIVIPISLNYDFVGHFSEGLAVVEKKDKYGFIDKSGKEVIPHSFIYGTYSNFYEGLALVHFRDKEGSGYIDQNGKIVIAETNYFVNGNFNEGLAEVKITDEWGEESKYGFIDKKGKVVIPCVYDKVAGFNDGLAYFEKEGTAGFINKLGQQVISLTNYDKPLFGYYFSEGLAVIEKDGKYGYINKEGEETTSFIYDYAASVREGYALVKLNDQFGYLKVVK